MEKRYAQCLRYHAMADINPRSPEKIHHPSNRGWGDATLDWALDERLIVVGPRGWHVLTPKGEMLLSELPPARYTAAPGDAFRGVRVIAAPRRGVWAVYVGATNMGEYPTRTEADKRCGDLKAMPKADVIALIEAQFPDATKRRTAT